MVFKMHDQIVTKLAVLDAKLSKWYMTCGPMGLRAKAP